MLARLNLKSKPDENLVMEFIMKIPSKIADSTLVRFIEHEMHKKLKEKRDSGFSGWNTPQIENKDLLISLKRNLKRGDYIDVINLAAMLHARKNMFIEKHHTPDKE